MQSTNWIKKILSSAKYFVLFLVLIFVFFASGVGVAFFLAKSNEKPTIIPAQPTISTENSDTDEISGQKLKVNAQLEVSGRFNLSPSELPQDAVPGTIVFDQDSGILQYFNGSEFIPLTAQEPIPAQTAGVTSLQGQAGAVNLVAGTGISINGTTISTNGAGLKAVNGTVGHVNVVTSNNVATVSLPQSVAPTFAPTFSGLTLNGDLSTSSTASLFGNNLVQTGAGQNISIDAGSDSIIFTTGGRTFQLPTSGPGSQTICTTGISCVSGGGQAILLAPGSAQTDNTSDVSIFVNDTGGGNLLQLQSSGSDRFTVATNGDATLRGSISLSNGTFTTTLGRVNPTANTTINLPALSTGTYEICTSAGNCAASVAVDSVNTFTGDIDIVGTPNQVTVGNSLGTITIGTVQDIAATSSPTFAGLTLTNDLTVANGGTGASSFTANGILYGNGASAIGVTAAGATGQCLLATTGSAPTWGSCPGAGGIASLTLAGSSGTPQTLTDGDILTIAAGTNITTTSGTTDTVTVAMVNNPTFSGLITANGGLTVEPGDTFSFNGDGFTDLTGTGLTISGGSLQTTLGTSVDLASAEVTGILPVANGGLGVSSLTANAVIVGNGSGIPQQITAGGAGLCLVSTAGAPSFSACPGAGGVTSLNGETGVLTLANASASSGTITINDASTAQKGIAQFNSTNFTVTSGVVNTIQNITTTSSPTFAGLTLTAPLSVANGGTGATDAPNARANLSAAANGANIDITSLGAVTLINPSSALTLGSSGYQLSLQGNDTSEWVVTDSGFTTTIGFESPTANVDFLFPALTAGSYEICTSDGNCASGPVGANTSLSNLSSVAINTSLLPGSTTIDLGSSAAAFRDLYLGGTATNNFQITGTASVPRTITLPDASGEICLSSGNCIGGGGGSAPSGASYLTLSLDGSLSAERILTAGTNIGFSDAGANGSLTVSVDAVPEFDGINVGVASLDDGNIRFYNSSNNNYVDLVSGTPSANRTVTLPDASGVLCVSSGNCIGAGQYGDILQNGNAFGAAMTIGTNDSNDLNFEVNDETVATFSAANGSFVLQNTLDSTSAFRVNDESGWGLFTIDTENSRFGFGTDTPVAFFEITGDVTIGSNRALKWNSYYNGVSDVYLSPGSSVQQWHDESGNFYRFAAAADGLEGDPVTFVEAFVIDLNSGSLGDVVFDQGTLTVDSSANAIQIGNSGTLSVEGLATFEGNLRISDGSSNYATIDVEALAGNYTVSIPTITSNDTFCLESLNNCAGTDTFTTIQVDTATQNTNAATLDFDGTDLVVAESPTDTFDISVRDTGASGFFRNGGNSFGQLAILGTNDANNLELQVNGNTAATFNQSNGSAVFQNSTNSNSAFNINNAAGTSVFAVDTVQYRAAIGNYTPGSIQGMLQITTSGNNINGLVLRPNGASYAADYLAVLDDSGNTAFRIDAPDGLKGGAVKLGSGGAIASGNSLPTWLVTGSTAVANATGSSGALYLETGDGRGLNGSSGDILIDVGDANGTGTFGEINIGASNASAILLGADTSIASGNLTVGSASNAGSLSISDGSSNFVSLTVNALAGNYSVAIPTITGNDTFCLLNLSNCSGGVTDLQGAYAGGNTISATDSEGDIDFTLNEATSFNVNANGTGSINILGTNTTSNLLNVGADNLTTGTALSVSSSSGALTSGNLLTVDHTATYNATTSLTNNSLKIARNLSINNSGAPQVVIDTNTSYNSGSSNPLTHNFSHTVNANSNQVLIVGIAGNSRHAVSASFNGTPMTLFSQDVYKTVWYLVNPPAVTANVSFTMNNTAYAHAHATTVYNVDQSTPLSNVQTVSGNAGTSSLNIASSAGDKVFDLIQSSNALTVGAGQTVVHNADAGGIKIGASYEDGASSVTMSWSKAGGGNSTHMAYNVNAVSSPGLGVTGSTADISSNCNIILGDCYDSSNVLSITQGYSGATGSVLKVTGAGTGSLAEFIDGTDTVFTIADGGLVTAADNINVQGGTATLGTDSQVGLLSISDGSSNYATIDVDALAGNYTVSIPTITGNDSFCLVTLANCAGGGGDILQGGNTFGEDVVLGAQDEFGLSFMADSTAFFHLDTDGLLQGIAGTNLSVPGTGNNSEQIGLGADASGNNSLAVGNQASATGPGVGSIAIGYQATATSGFLQNGAIAIGLGASASGDLTTAFGRNSTASDDSAIAFGASATASGLSSVAIGVGTNATGSSSLSVGNFSTAGASAATAVGNGSNSSFSNSIALGANATTTAANQLVVGSAGSISSVYIGGVTGTSPQDFSLNAMGGDGADIAGADISIAGGRGTGSGAGGAIYLQTAAAGSTGSILNTLQTRLSVLEDGEVQINSGQLSISDGSSNYATINAEALAGDYTVSIPTITVNDTFCLETLNNCSASLFTDSGTHTYLTSVTDEFVIGSSSSVNAKMGIIGTSDETQLLIRGNGTQTSDILSIQNAAGDTTYLSLNNSGRLSIGGVAAAESASPVLLVTNAEVQGNIYIGDSSGNIQNSGSGGSIRFSGSARNDISVSLKPEFDGAVLRADGSDNIGYMASGFCSGSSRMNINASNCGATETYSYYEWTTVEPSAQDYDMFVRWRVPSNFDPSERFSSVTVHGWRTDSTNNLIDVGIYNAAGNQCGTTTQVAGDSAWAGTAIANMASDSDCDISAGDYITFRIRMNADDGDYVRLGQIEIGYKAVF